MKPIHFSQHALLQMSERGATREEVIEAIRSGEHIPAKHGRIGCRKNFQYERLWGNRFFQMKQVLAIIADDPEKITVVTVYTFYF